MHGFLGETEESSRQNNNGSTITSECMGYNDYLEAQPVRKHSI